MVALAEYPIRSIRFFIIYRPPSSQIKAFLEYFVSLLEQLVPISGNLLIVGAFNFHLDDSNNTDAIKLHNPLESFNLKQHVATPTHSRGHTLDLIIRSEDDLLDGIVVRDPTCRKILLCTAH